MSLSSEERLWAAARAVARRLGPGFTMEDIAFEAGVSRATAYRVLESQRVVVERLTAEGVVSAGDTSLRARVLAATREVVSRLGFDGLTIAAVAEQAGCGQASVYRLFESREALLRAWGDGLAPRRAARGFAVDEDSPLEPALAGLGQELIEALRSDGGVLSAALVASGDSRQWMLAARRRHRGTIAALREAFAGRIKRGELEGDPAELAVAFCGLLLTFGWLAPAIGEPVDEDAAALARRVARRFLAGVRPRGRKEAR
ncbi:MAG: TetR family transcriptional regulator [Myxococcales bacterium]|nr:TetR family transcriptional regulator [Myxococcales bacterium]